MKVTKDETVTLENIGNGIVAKKFLYEFTEAVANCLDIDTKPDAWREVVIRCRLKPNENRTAAVMEVHASNKIIASKPFVTQVFIGEEMGQAVAYEAMKQDELPFGENVKPFKAKEGGKE